MYDFRDVLYVRSHGKAPRGRGCWSFELKGRSDPLFASFGTLTAAKREISAKLKAEGVPSGTIVYIAP